MFIRFFVVFLGDYERAIIFRLGKFNRIGGPGWTIRIPWIEEVYRVVDVRYRTLDLPEIRAFTNNDILLKLEVVSFFKILDPHTAVLQVQDYERALEKRLAGQVRNYIGSMMLRQVFANIDLLNERLKEELNKISRVWGLLVERVEVVQMELPEDVVEALYSPLTAEQELLSTRFTAEARKVVIEAIGEAAGKLDDRAINVLYLKALQEMAKGKATKIIFPLAFTKFLRKHSDTLNMRKTELEHAIKSIIRRLGSK